MGDPVPPAVRLQVELGRRSDGATVLRCVRPDGSVTWQKQEGGQAGFFPGHDLTHFAVESELGATLAFYGLIASGWEIDDTTGKRRRGPLPAEAVVVEHIVGLLDVERGSGRPMSGEDFRAALAAKGKTHAALDDGALLRIRARRGELLARWRALGPGEALNLTFPHGGRP